MPMSKELQDSNLTMESSYKEEAEYLQVLIA